MFVVFDIETTGFSTMSCDIIQFAYVMFDSNNQFVKAESLYYYYEGMSWSQEAADASHHLTLEFLKQHEDEFEANLLKMYSVLNRCNVIGHNSNDFDCPFVKNWLSRMGLEDFQFGVQQDTMRAFKPITKRARIKLTKLAELMKISQQTVNMMTPLWFKADSLRGPHDAAYDVTLTAILTLAGIGKNLISFEYTMAATTAYDEDLSLDGETVEGTAFERPMDVIGYIVHLIDSADSDSYAWVNHDRSKYRELDVLTGDDQLKYLNSNPYLNVPLLKQRDKVYAGEYNGIKFTYMKGDKDYVQIETPYATMRDIDIDIMSFIERNFMNGGAA